jgi:hypothetical protein
MRDWNMKRIQRLIVTSATYRQSSRVTPELLERDPYNRLVARGPRFRVEAEMVRDIALTASGLLSPKMFGPPVMPYQPEGVWDRPYSDEKWVMSTGEDRYRRAIYTFVRRTAGYPSMITFDAPSREFCTVRRPRTDTPLQALTTLNDPAFFEAAKALAARMMKEAGATPEQRASYGFRLCTARRPSERELQRIVAFYRQQLTRARNAPAPQQATPAPSAVVSTKAAGGGSQTQNAPQQAAPATALGSAASSAQEVSPETQAWTMVANVLLNLDETITKE